TSTLRAVFAELEKASEESVTSHAPVTVTGHAPDTAKTGTGNREGEGLEPPIAPLGDLSQGQQAKKPAARPKAEGARAKPRKPLQMPFLMTPEMLAWAKEKAPAVNLDRETERFCDYWTGTGKAMADWPSTWRNWMRRAQDDIERRGGGPGGRPPGAPGDVSWIEEDDGV